ncbi:hypothetical protein KXX59_007630 [Aspergillus fumigatus]|nr:hypothetical protein KXX37_009596 [Aspergillus fumigatus]KAH1646714.1 hypothetical protein KXX59_007630 [Aspergillus fumigatus]
MEHGQEDGVKICSYTRSHAGDSVQDITDPTPSALKSGSKSLLTPDTQEPATAASELFSHGGIGTHNDNSRHSMKATGSTVSEQHFDQAIRKSPGPVLQRPRCLDIGDSMIGLVDEPLESYAFFGSSSAGSFMRQMQQAIDYRLGVQHQPTKILVGETNKYDHKSAQRAVGHRSTIEYVLPSRKTADSLANAYWELVYPLYPFLNRAAFNKGYEAIWTGLDTDNENVLVCTTNVIFALGSQVSSIIEPEQRQETAQLYYNRSQSLVDSHFHDRQSIDVVSLYLLMGIYLQSVGSPQRCWMVVGHAIRLAQSLGLHRPDCNFAGGSSRERETACRIWHGCILMDRVLAMTFGRPAMIPKWLSAAVPLPKMIDDEFLDTQVEGSPVRPDGRPCIMEFFVCQLELYDIMDDILLELYMGKEDRQKAVDAISIFKLDNSLANWTRGLSPQLHIDDTPPSDTTPLLRRLDIVNKVRFLHARMLLLRPILAQYCLPQSTEKQVDSLCSRMVMQGSKMCLETAHRTIELIYSHLDSSTVTGPVPAWWYSVLYIYTAATVLLSERLRPEIAIGIENFSNAVSWQRAILVLNTYARVANSAKRCVAALEILSAKIPWAEHQPEYVHPGQHIASAGSDFLFGSDPNVGEINLNDIHLNLNDGFWLNSIPENLQFGI